jgi:opacity protein-like surface antigen
MNKHTLSAAICAAALFSGNAMAQAYVSGDIGMGHASLSCEGTDSCSNNDVSFGVTGGFVLGKGFAAEIGYVSFGTAKASDTGLEATFKSSAWTYGVAYQAPIDAAWAVDLRLGAASVKSTLSATDTGTPLGSFSDTQTSPYYGLGVSYQVAKNVKLRAGALWTHAKVEDLTTNVRTVSAGARYDF